MDREPRAELETIFQTGEWCVFEQLLDLMRSMRERKPRYTGRTCHFHVVRRIADHECVLGCSVEFAHEPLQHLGMRLRKALIRTSRSVEVRAQTGRIEGAVQTAPTFAGGDRKPMASRAKRVQHVGRACKQRRVAILREEMVTIALDD